MFTFALCRHGASAIPFGWIYEVSLLCQLANHTVFAAKDVASGFVVAGRDAVFT